VVLVSASQSVARVKSPVGVGKQFGLMEQGQSKMMVTGGCKDRGGGDQPPHPARSPRN